MNRKNKPKPDRPRQHLGQERQRKVLAGELEKILHRVDRLPILDSRTPDEILGHDKHGLPNE